VAREIKKAEEDEAPGYMVLYSSLMSLLLAFFVTMLAMGQERTAQFKTGVGQIRDAFGLRGGFGVLPYWRSMSQWLASDYPKVTKEEDQDAKLIGYLKGVLWREGLDESFILDIEYDRMGATIIMRTPIKFGVGNAFLERDSRWFLNRMGGVFYNLPEALITVSCLVETSGREAEDDRADEYLAIERAVAVNRYLIDEVKISEERLQAVGYAHERYLRRLDEKEVVFFYIRSDRKDLLNMDPSF
jgi:chemotaxis protein MotB